MLNNTNAGWPQKPLSEVVDLNPRLDKSAYRDDLEVSFVPMAAVEAGSGRMEASQTKQFSAVKKGYTPFKERDVLFAKITPCMENGKMAVVPKLTSGLGFGSTEFHVLRPHEGIDPRFVYYFVSSQNFRREAAHRMTGAVGQKRVPQSFLEKALIPVPLFVDQERIVAEIEKQFSRLDEAVANLKRVKANLKRYKASVLKAAVEGKLTEDWRKQHPNIERASKLLERILAERRAKWSGRGKYTEPEAAAAAGLPPLPKGWTWARLEQLGMIFGGLTKNPKRAKLTKKLPYLRVANVYANELRLDEIQHIGVQDSELEKLLLQRGDLLVVEGNGSKDQIGRLAIWDGSIDPCVHQNHLIKARLIIASMNKWILFWLLSPIGRHLIEKVSSSTSGLYTLSVNKVGDLSIIVPSVAEQELIVAEVERRLSVIDELEAAVEANLTRADRLRQSVLARAFSGELTTLQ
jgi:type I restriction enzyme S subunit